MHTEAAIMGPMGYQKKGGGGRGRENEARKGKYCEGFKRN